MYYIEEFLKEFNNKKIKLFVDMDGVIADYNVGQPARFDIKRPLLTSIEKIRGISKMSNIDLYILSVTRMSIGEEEKNTWLDKYAPFFKKKNRVIISREANDFKEARELKANYLKKLNRDGSLIIVIDDDPAVLKKIAQENKDVILLKDTALID